MPGLSRGRKRKAKATSSSGNSQSVENSQQKQEAKYVPRFGSINKRAKLVLKKNNGSDVDSQSQELSLTQPAAHTFVDVEDKSEGCSNSLTQVPATQPAHVHHMPECQQDTERSHDKMSATQQECEPDKEPMPATQPVHVCVSDKNVNTSAYIPVTQTANVSGDWNAHDNIPTTVTKVKHVSGNVIDLSENASAAEQTDKVPPILPININKEFETDVSMKASDNETGHVHTAVSDKEHTPVVTAAAQEEDDIIPGFSLTQVSSQYSTNKETEIEPDDNSQIKQEVLEEGSMKNRGVPDKVGEVTQGPIEVVEDDSRNLSLLNPFSEDCEDNQVAITDEADKWQETGNHENVAMNQVDVQDVVLPSGIHEASHQSQNMHTPEVHVDATLPHTCSQDLPVVPVEGAHGTSPLTKQPTATQSSDTDPSSQEEIQAVQEMMDLTAADLLESQLTTGVLSCSPALSTLQTNCSGERNTSDGSKMLRGLIEELSTINQFVIRCKRELECARRQRSVWGKTKGHQKFKS